MQIYLHSTTVAYADSSTSRVTTDEERVLRGRQREIKLYMYRWVEWLWEIVLDISEMVAYPSGVKQVESLLASVASCPTLLHQLTVVQRSTRVQYITDHLWAEWRMIIDVVVNAGHQLVKFLHGPVLTVSTTGSQLSHKARSINCPPTHL